MAVRTIDAPGIEIHEIDKSQYSPAMTGTKVLVTGFANSGEDYTPMIFTSKSAWLNYYGEPDNEAERYFYAASMEVLNQNGVVNCCKLPYENEARDKFVGQKYKLVTVKDLEITTVKEALSPNGKLYNLNSIIPSSNKYNRDVIDHFMSNVIVTDVTDKEFLQNSDAKIEDLDKATNEDDRSDELVGGDSFYKTYCYDSDSEVYTSELSNKAALIDSFNGVMTKTQLISYINDISGALAGVMPKFNAYYTISTSYNLDEEPTSDTEYLSDLLSVYPYIENMAQTVVDINNYYSNLEGVKKYQDVYAKFIEKEYLTDFSTWKDKNVKQLFMSIYDFATIASNGEPVPAASKDLVTFTDYFNLLDQAIKEGNLQGKIEGIKISVRQDISVIIAYAETGEYTTLTAYNEYVVPRPTNKEDTISDFIITQIDNLISAKGIDGDPSDMRDGIYTIFDAYPEAANREYVENNNLILEKTVGYTAFNVMFQDDAGLDIVNGVANVVNNRNFNLIKIDPTDISVAINYFESLKNNIDTVKDGIIEMIRDTLRYNEIREADDNVRDYWEIQSQGKPSLYELTAIDEYRTDESRVGTNQILIVDKTRKPYTKIPEDKNHKSDECELIGIIPIITTAANALYAQSMINVDDADILDYENIRNVMTLDCSVNPYKFLGKDCYTSNEIVEGEISGTAVISQRFNNKHTIEDNDDDFFDSVALEANNYFSSISLQADGSLDRENMKKIGLVVVKAFLDASEGNKISFQTVEAFVGSLDRDAKNPNTGATTFIDTIVNEQSEYVNIFTNCLPTDSLKQKYKDKIDILVMPHNNANVASLGFYEGMCEEDIDVSESILKSMDIVYEKVTDINERDIDIVVDGGISNIAQFIKSVYGKKGFYNPSSPDAALWKCKKDSDVKMWKTVIMKMDNFCKNIRKDCMFIADGPRPYCLQGQKKIVRPSKPTNTIDVNILPYTKYLTGINTSYGAGYCDWFQIADEFSGDYFWCPPSIKACGIYIYTDLNFEYWDAPAGLNRGIVAALDVAFSPTNKQAGQIYTKNWNYAINYPADGIVLEGQKTLQTKPSALDRVNVRRLLLRLERATYKVLRYVVYEGNTAYMRQRVVDLLDPYFKEAKIGGGLYDYKIICDESNNTATTIDRNELHISIGVKPTKTIEFIICNFVILSTGASWDEM